MFYRFKISYWIFSSIPLYAKRTSNLILEEGACYHITHRCHDRDFLLAFAKDREQYRRRLLKEIYDVSVLNYMVTSNHILLLLSASISETISEVMRTLHGSFAQDYNRRKGREGSFWRGRYHSTLIEDGVHLARYLLYVDVNMVRAGVVSHPSEWRWSGYHDLSGERERYVIVDVAALCERLNGVSVPKFRSWYMESIDEKLEMGELEREAAWSKATAVGSAPWIDGVDKSMQVGARERGVLKEDSTMSAGFLKGRRRKPAGTVYVKGSRAAERWLRA